MLLSFFDLRTISLIQQVGTFELKELINKDNNLLIVDVRSPREYQYDGHFAGSRLIPLSALIQRVKELPRDQSIVFVCRLGKRSLVACEQMNRLGHNNVKNFRGGMIAWKKAGLPTR